MKFVFFIHSLISDWNHGNAHFLRGVIRELIKRKHEVSVLEPLDGWSYSNLLKDYGPKATDEFKKYYPDLDSKTYEEKTIDLDEAIGDAQVVIVHEWNSPDLISKIGKYRNQHNCFRLFFHDTHHRAITSPEQIEQLDLENYDGVLAFGELLKEIYIKNKWISKAWAWHEAADITLFHPVSGIEKPIDVIWIGNWGDDERKMEIEEYLINPVSNLNLKCEVYGVRYPLQALKLLEKKNVKYRGWLPNYKAPEKYAQSRLTVHIPRGPYVEKLIGIPTIRPFEAMACGIPLISSYWNDCERLFEPGDDFVLVKSRKEMESAMNDILNNCDYATTLAKNALITINAKHTCSHRVSQLLEICRESGVPMNENQYSISNKQSRLA